MTAAPFEWSMRVYWEDTDGGGIVYYANYLKFLERARTEWLRSLGYSQQALATDPGLLFAVVNVLGARVLGRWHSSEKSDVLEGG